MALLGVVLVMRKTQIPGRMHNMEEGCGAYAVAVRLAPFCDIEGVSEGTQLVDMLTTPKEGEHGEN
jgi:hypothetical protein